MKSRRLRPLFAAVAWALLLSSAPAAAAPRSYTIVIDKMKFGAVPANLHKGDIIVWDNRDMFLHNAMSKGEFDFDLPAGKKVAIRLKKAGTFSFTCKYHPGMKGVLKVLP
jgi:plastocyanin